MHRINYLLMTILLLLASAAHAAEWGDLTATFVYDGTAPAPVKANVNKDIPYCGKFNVLDETVIVNPKNGGVANNLSFLYVSRTGKKPAVHPDFAKTANDGLGASREPCPACLASPASRRVAAVPWPWPR